MKVSTWSSIAPGLTSSILFSVFNGVTGIINRSPWLISLSVYYFLLSIMRIGIVGRERQIATFDNQRERIRREISVCYKNSVIFIMMSVVLGGMVVLLEHSIGGAHYPGFTIYAVAAYTFYRIVKSTIAMIKERKENVPLHMLLRKINYIDACVAILTLQTAMFSAFGEGQEALAKTMNGLTGAGVCLIVLGMGIQGIYVSKKKKREIRRRRRRK